MIVLAACASGEGDEAIEGDNNIDTPDSRPLEVSATENECGGSEVLEATPGTSCGACGLGTYACDGTDAVVCEGAPDMVTSITASGQADASTTFDGFPAPLSADGDDTTAWFSTGPEDGGKPTEYTWELPIGSDPACIHAINVKGLATHAVEFFRTGFGFGQLTIQVFELDSVSGQNGSGEELEEPVFSANADLSNEAGQSDPDVMSETEGVLGRRVKLLFSGHESDECGGFTELDVQALQ